MACLSWLRCSWILIFIVFSIKLTHSHNVPVFIWGPKSHSSFPALSALSHVSSEQFKKGYLKEILSSGDHKNSVKSKVPVLAFIQDRLSLEDLSVHGNGLTPQGKNYKHLQVHMDENPSLVLPSVEDPFQVLREIKGHQSIDTLNYNDDIHHKLSGIKSDVTLIYLPTTVGLDNRLEALKANDELISKAVSHFGKNYLAMLTGKEPSWDAASEEASHRRIARNLLQTASDSETSTFLFHMDSAKVKIDDPQSLYNMTSQNLTVPPTTDIKADNETVAVSWKFSPTEELKSLTINIEFVKRANYWKTSFVAADFQTDKLGDVNNLTLKANRQITAGNGFSFSCGNTVLTGKANYTIYITLHNFQVEPYSSRNFSTSSNSSFSESFHCSTFFTLPIWMGFFTVLLFTVILGLGIFMLFQVKTMDRFDDPKGKTITVPQSE